MRVALLVTGMSRTGVATGADHGFMYAGRVYFAGNPEQDMGAF